MSAFNIFALVRSSLYVAILMCLSHLASVAQPALSANKPVATSAALVKRIVYRNVWNFRFRQTEAALQPSAAVKPEAASRRIFWDFWKAIEQDNVVGVRKGLHLGIGVSSLLPEYRQTPLMMAAERDSPRVFNFLLARHADVRVRDSDGRTVVHYAVASSAYGAKNGIQHKRETRHLAMLRTLMLRGLSLNDRAHNGETPLMLLVEYDMTMANRLQFLVHNGANINSLNDFGLSALHIAVERDYVEMARLLLANGADPNIRTKAGITPLMLAANVSDPDIAMLQLLAKGTALSARDKEGRTPLIYLLKDAFDKYHASYYDNESEQHGATYLPPREDFLHLLLRKGADINALDKQGRSALAWAKATVAKCETDELRKQAQHIADILITAGAVR